MASSQQAVIPSKHQVVLDEMMKKEAGNIDVKSVTHGHAVATIRNRTPGDLRLVRGDENAPKIIPEGGSVTFVTKNSKRYVIYDGTNVQGGPHNCGWLLAWHVHSDGHGNQVYVECGAKEKIVAMPDPVIYMKLAASGSSSTYVDAETNTNASAQIEAMGSTPRLGCDFGVGGNQS